MDQEIKLIDEKVKAKSEFVERINKTMAGTIIGQKNIIDRLPCSAMVMSWLKAFRVWPKP